MVLFKDKLKEIRKLKNWSQQQFADKLEERRSTYAEWENGTIPSFDIVVKIAAVSKVSILEFVATIDENLARGIQEENHLHPKKNSLTIDFLMGKLEGKDDLIAEKEARRKDATIERDKYYYLIEKYLIELNASSKEIVDDLSAMNLELRSGQRAMMDSIDKAADLPIGTTAAAADNVELTSEKGRQSRGKKVGVRK